MNRFDKNAKDWEKKERRLLLAKKAFEAISEKVKVDKSKIIADFGAGTGLLHIGFQPHVKEIIALDNSQGMLNVLNEKILNQGITNIKPVFFDADKDEFNDINFDILISSMSFHHVNDIKAFLNKIYNQINENGQVCIADLVSEDGSFHSDNTGVIHFGFNPEEFALWMQETGFKDVETLVFHEIDSNDRKYPVFYAYAKK